MAYLKLGSTAMPLTYRYSLALCRWRNTSLSTEAAKFTAPTIVGGGSSPDSSPSSITTAGSASKHAYLRCYTTIVTTSPHYHPIQSHTSQNLLSCPALQSIQPHTTHCNGNKKNLLSIAKPSTIQKNASENVQLRKKYPLPQIPTTRMRGEEKELNLSEGECLALY